MSLRSPAARCPAAVVWLSAALLILGACSHTRVEQHPLALMPVPDAGAGWSWDLEPEIYTPETLFEYINGEAEIYIAYDFIEMATGVQILGDDILASVTFDVYDMGTPLNAFGIYSSFRRPELEFDAIGAEAIVSELNLRFWKGRFYVQVNAGDAESVLTEAMHAGARAVADAILPTALPEQFAWLPAEGRVPRSLRYVATGFLGQEVFEGALEARYAMPGGEGRAFVVEQVSTEAAETALATFRESLERQGQLAADAEVAVDRIDTDTTYYGPVSARAVGRFVIGTLGLADRSDADTLLEAIAADLPL